MKYRGGEKNYETNVTNCKRYWSTFQPNEPKQMFEQRDCKSLGKKWDFPGFENKYRHDKKPTKKAVPYYVPSKYGPMRDYAESDIMLAGRRRRTRRR
jgi:hypothetical protein